MKNKISFITFITLTLLYFNTLDVFGIIKVIRDNTEGRATIEDAQILKDSTNSIEIYEISENIYDSSFIPYTPETSLLEPNTYYWLKFKIKNTSYEDLIYLSFNIKLLEADLYLPINDSTFLLQRSGLKWSLKRWYLRYKKVLFALPGNSINPNKYYYIRVNSTYQTTSGIFLNQHRHFFNTILNDYLIDGIFFGIIIIAALYSIIFFVTMKELTYLYYFLYVISFACFAIVDWGLVLNFLAITKIQWSNDLYTIPYVLITIFLILYAKHFLDLKNKMPIWNIIAISLVVLRIIVFFTGKILNNPSFHNPIIDSSFLIFLYIAAIIRALKGFKPSWYLIFGFTVLFTGFFIHSYRHAIQQHNIAAFISLYKTGVAEIVIFSLALADRFRRMKSEKERSQTETINTLRENSELQERVINQLNENEELKDTVNKELEAKVQERTLELEDANLQIREMNLMLKKANIKLEGDVKTISRERVMQKVVSFEEFKKIYPNEDACYQYIEKLKWEDGYTCPKCGNNKYSAGTTPYSRRCSKCNYIARITSGTIFSGIKFPITKAFYMLFLINSGKNITVDELSEMISLRRQTCWNFKKKVETLMEENKKKLKKKGNWTLLIFLAEN